MSQTEIMALAQRFITQNTILWVYTNAACVHHIRSNSLSMISFFYFFAAAAAFKLASRWDRKKREGIEVR